MGLCKCPQRKVSTLFCFKHHVNVCESCLVQEHPQCIVRSYVSWLQDNDYNPNCSLCQHSLTETTDETIRLVCYDLFHWSCLDKYFRSFPSHTAPDGYTCPTCHTCIFPPKNLVSPVADHVREKLATVNWATSLSSLATNDSSMHQDKQKSITQTEKNGYVIVNSSASEPTTVDRGMGGLSHHPHRTTDAAQGSTMLTLKPGETDTDEEDKYKRRSFFTWFARWLRSRQTTKGPGIGSTSRTGTSRTRFTVYMICLILLVFFTVLTVLYHLTRGDNNEYVNQIDDPQFNPMNNPFIRVAGKLLRKRHKDADPVGKDPVN